MMGRITSTFALTLLAVASLFATAVPGCACSSHQAIAEATVEVSSCHEHTTKTADPNSDACASGDCICRETQQPAIDKSAVFKLKQPLVFDPTEPQVIIFEAASVIEPATRFQFATTETLDHHRLRGRSRAPPVQ